MKKRYLVILLVIVLGGGFYYYKQTNLQTAQPISAVPEVTKKVVKTQIVQTGAFFENLKTVGQIIPYDETIVSAQAQGNVTQIFTEIGKKVKAGELLAKIDTKTSGIGTNMENANIAYENSIQSYNYTKESMQKDIENAQTQMDNTKKSRENTYASTQKQLELAQAQLDNIKTSKKNTISSNDQLIKLSEIGVETAKKSYDSAQIAYDNFKNSSVESIKNLSESNSITTSNLLNQVDLILGVSDLNRGKNDDYEMYLSAKNSQLKTKAETLYTEVSELYEDMKKQDIYSIDYTKIGNYISLQANVVNKTISLTKTMMDVLDNSISTITFPESIITSYKQVIGSYQTALLQLQSQLLSLKSSLANQPKTMENAIDIAKKQIDNANQNLESAKTNSSSSIDTLSGNENLTKIQLETTITSIKTARDNADDAYKMTKLQYESLLAKNNSALTQAKSQIDSIKGQKNAIGVQVNNTEIKAPFDGIVMQKSINIGQLVNPGTPSFTLGKDDKWKIRMELDSDNIKTLQIGKEFKASKGNNYYTGHIILISPSADPQSKLFTIEGEFKGDKKSYGISDFLDISIQKKVLDQEVISVPYSSLISLGQGKYIVFVLDKDGTVRSKEVIIGEKNEESIIIKSGLRSGDKIIINGALGLQDGDIVVES